MVFSKTLKKSGVVGNLRYKQYYLVDVSTTGSKIYPGFRKIIDVLPLNKESGLNFKVTISESTATAPACVTLTAATEHDGYVMILGKGSK